MTSDIRDLIAQYRCPDCGAPAELLNAGGSVTEVEIRHETTCPYYQSMLRGDAS